MKICFFALAVLFVCPSWALPVDIYRLKAIEHRGNVFENMIKLLRRYPKVFSNTTESEVRQYATLHDLPKLQSMQSLKAYDYEGEKNIAEILSSHFGAATSELTGARSVIFKHVISELNRIEGLQKELFFNRLRSAAPVTAESTIEELKILEHVADVVDTGLGRKAEMGGALLGSEYLGTVEKAAPVFVRMAQFLEDTLPSAETVMRDLAVAIAALE